MSTVTPVIRIPDDLDPPKGYHSIKIEKGDAAGRYAVLPRPRCKSCLTNEPGLMLTYQPGAKHKKDKEKLEPCACILSQLAEFLRKEHVQPGYLSPPPKPNGKSALELQVERIDEVITQKQRYVDERTKVISQLKVERDEAIAKVQAEVEQTLVDEAALEEEHDSLLVMAEACEERIHELRAEAKDLLVRAEHLTEELAKLDADEARDRVRTTEVEYQGAVDLAKSDGRYRRYQADVERLRGRRAKLVPPLAKVVDSGKLLDEEG
jgi:hypothetical protein